MSDPEPSIRIRVDPTNPGQFFACCGLLELADRLWIGAEGWFRPGEFLVSAGGDLPTLIGHLARAELTQVDEEDDTESPVEIGEPFRKLRLDWWHDKSAGGREMKVWSGRMRSYRIAWAMQRALSDAQFLGEDLLNVGGITYDEEGKKTEPYYFDARRGSNAHPRDVGFSADALEMMTTAFPAVELLCLVGLQRCLPARTDRRREFEYSNWSSPLPTSLLPAAVSGLLPEPSRTRYRFENWYRTGQKKYKAFRSAIPNNP